MATRQVLPGTGRGTVRRTVEGGVGVHSAWWMGKAPMLSMVLLPVPRRT
jgi:hypothetical protein